MKDLKFPLLYSPLKVGPLTFRNRIEGAPMSMTEMDAKEGLTPESIAFYGRLAQGGAAVVTVGESIIRTDCGKTHPQMLMLGRDEVLPYLVAVTDAIHRHGALANIEISHGGAMADPIYNNGKLSIAPMGYIDEWGDEVIAMTEEMMDDVAEAFAEAAATVKDCGFDMCMIHAGHGWLLNQFLSPKHNRRTDQYGGSRENRCRFPLMVLERVRNRVGRNFALDMRISGEEFCEGGATIEDAIYFAKQAEKYIDIMNVSAGAPWTRRMIPGVFDKPGFNTYLAAEVRKHVSIPVTTVGGYVDPAFMEQKLQEGAVDGFIIGHGLLADPDIPIKGLEGRDEDITRCLRCNMCFKIKYSTRAFKCTVNPRLGRYSQDIEPKPTTEPKRVLVAGGGPAGLKAAAVAAERGHEVILCEASHELGGALLFARHIPFKKEIDDLMCLLIRQAQNSGAEIRLNTRVTPELVREINPDVVVSAIGAEPIIPPIPGVDNKKVVLGTRMFDEGVQIGQKVVVIGGGLVGSEAGLHLAMEGHDVTIIEMLPELARDAAPNHKTALNERLAKAADGHVNTRCVAITDEGVIAEDADGQKTFPADTVILAAGLRALRADADALRMDGRVKYYAIGDCTKPAKIMEALRQGFDVGSVI